MASLENQAYALAVQEIVRGVGVGCALMCPCCGLSRRCPMQANIFQPLVEATNTVWGRLWDLRRFEALLEEGSNWCGS